MGNLLIREKRNRQGINRLLIHFTHGNIEDKQLILLGQNRMQQISGI
jgi:hypothetical protein